MLRAIAGLEAAQGTIRFDGTDWLNSNEGRFVKPHERPIGYVRQNAQLFPHLTVEGNLTYPLKHSIRSQDAITIDQVVTDFDLAKLLPRRIDEVSGGETQRVVMARMLLSQPRLLLLDEPLTGLDLQRKAEILPYLEALQMKYQLPTLYVSHAIDEVTALCSDTVVLVNGEIVASGATAEVLEKRELEELLGKDDSSSLVAAKVLTHDEHYQLTSLQVEDRQWSVPMHLPLAPGTVTTLRVRARDVAIAKSEPTAISVRNVLYGEVVAIDDERDGPSVDCVIQAGSTRLRARITRASLDDLALRIGDAVFALIKSVSIG